MLSLIRRLIIRRPCAACGMTDLRTLPGDRYPAEAGFCPRCGVYVGLECAGTDSSRSGFASRTCPGCRGRMRTDWLWFNSAYFGITISLSALVAAAMFWGIGTDSRALAAEEERDPGDLTATDSFVKIAGRIQSGRTPALFGGWEGSGDERYWIWYPEDFRLVGGNGSAMVNVSKLWRKGQYAIYLPERENRTYLDGDRVVVVGEVEWRNGSAVVLAEYIAPNSIVFAGDQDLITYGALAFSPIFGALGIAGLAVRQSRLSAHGLRAEEFALRLKSFGEKTSV